MGGTGPPQRRVPRRRDHPKYAWDLDGNGSFETDTGSSAVTTHQYNATGLVSVQLRVTDNELNDDDT